MAFVSFTKKNMGGEKNPSSVPEKDGQFVFDTSKGYLYLDNGSSNSDRIPVVDRRDAKTIKTQTELRNTKRNGWYLLDFSKAGKDTKTFNLEGKRKLTEE